MRVEEIKAAIEKLPGADFVEIRNWVAEKDWQMWNRELEADSKAEAFPKTPLPDVPGASKYPPCFSASPLSDAKP